MEQLEQLEQLNRRSRPRAYADEEWKRGVPAVPGPTPTLPTEGGRGGGGIVKNEKLLEIMQRDRYLLQQRDRCIRLHWQALVGRGVPRMRAYAQTAESYYLSEKRVRDIVREGEDPPRPSLQREGEGGPTPALPTEGGGGPTPALATEGGGREGEGRGSPGELLIL